MVIYLMHTYVRLIKHIFKYKMHDDELNNVKYEKDLDVFIICNLKESSSKQVSE